MQNESTNKKSVPNIVVWSWVRTVLGLSGCELLIFSYLFSRTFDNVHRCYTALMDFSDWFGITRQAVSRHITKLCERGYIEKETLQDKTNPMIKHNSYMVCMQKVTQLCEESDDGSYANFLESYSSILKQKFPNDSATIDDYICKLSSWHKNRNIEVCATLGELSQAICADTGDNKVGLMELLESIREHSESFTKYRASTFNGTEKKTVRKKKASASGTLIDVPKRQSKQALKNEWDSAKRQMAASFVAMRLQGNEELLELLMRFLDTDNGRNYSPDQWQRQLDNMYDSGRTVERMIVGVRTSYMNNYRSLYLADKNEIDIQKKLDEVDRYVAEEAENSDELRELLKSYVLEVPKGKSSTIKQFKLALVNLSNLCETTKKKIESVRTSYTNSYAALAYPNSSTVSDEPIDMDKKHSEVEAFIADGFYYLCDDLRDSLHVYIDNTQAGRTMSYETFCIILDNLRLFCLDDGDKVSKVKLAIQRNSNWFATEDFEETRKIKAKFETRETMAASFDRSRKHRVMQYKQNHPNDERLANVAAGRTGMRVI